MLAAEAPVKPPSADGIDGAGLGPVEQLVLVDHHPTVLLNHLLLFPAHTHTNTDNLLVLFRIMLTCTHTPTPTLIISPVSNISFLSKITDKIVLLQLT